MFNFGNFAVDERAAFSISNFFWVMSNSASCFSCHKCLSCLSCASRSSARRCSSCRDCFSCNSKRCNSISRASFSCLSFSFRTNFSFSSISVEYLAFISFLHCLTERGVLPLSIFNSSVVEISSDILLINLPARLFTFSISP